ncbi:helix-turn-helix domain-containing protein [Weissella paramesenteroides]|nr:helix-turn-helix domain-containing protein [Weissella paramesenteroides]KAA8456826.1 helix-turn-helix domain-containing protein [Weissella paramesenteroides]KAA8458359.1 helix-turn-helix domain-containing protein [Weissella paramesenteroides]KAA8459651.1 helix-turn-helix domain-containing protein [Weissella paramesenteroides]KAA8462661.1 helix-turn-helix domain-containing protein [Weissella paramesenteroides]
MFDRLLQKLKLIRLYQESTSSERAFSKLHNIGRESIQDWIRLYDEFGLE